MIRLRNCTKWLVILWISYATAMGIFLFALPIEPNPNGPGKEGAALIATILTAVLSFGLWKHRES